MKPERYNFLKPERYYNVKIFLQAAIYFAVVKHRPKTVSDISILTKHCLDSHWLMPNQIPTALTALHSVLSVSQMVALFAVKIPASRLGHAATQSIAVQTKASFARALINLKVPNYSHVHDKKISVDNQRSLSRLD